MNDSSVSPARSVAFDLLRAVLAKHTPLDEALGAHHGLTKMLERERGFARTLVASTLRQLGRIDKMIDHRLQKPLPDYAEVVRDILRLGVCELLVLEIPAHATVDNAVNQTRLRGHDGFAGVVNAILRRIDREDRDRFAELSPLDALPDWMAQSWKWTYGDATAEAMAAACQVEPNVDISVKSNPEAWATKLEAKLLPTGTLRRPLSGRVEKLAGFNDGEWWVQDMAAALPAKLLGDVKGRKVLDICAAPGGKTVQLASAGAEVIAIDRSKNRLKRLEENLERLHLSVATVVADASKWQPPAKVGAILLDAPCSATGTIRRHPDIPWLKSEQDVEKLADLQDRLLDNAASMLSPGGTLVYCTCSLEAAEGQERLETFLTGRGDLERVPVKPEEVGGLSQLITEKGELRTRPDHLPEFGGLDGFYACRLRKRGLS